MWLITCIVQTWNLAGHAVRQAIPIGINDALDDAYYGHLIDSWRDRALHPGMHPRGPDELELRRSAFWLAYILDIQCVHSIAHNHLALTPILLPRSSRFLS